MSEKQPVQRAQRAAASGYAVYPSTARARRAGGRSPMTRRARGIGVGTITDPKHIGMVYRYSPAEVADQLHLPHWYNVNQLLERVHREKGVDIKASDNLYHYLGKSGRKRKSHLYSERLVALLADVSANGAYELDPSVVHNSTAPAGER